MTDFSNFKAMLDKAEIVYSVTFEPNDKAFIVIYGMAGPNNHGYSGFSAIFEFFKGEAKSIDVGE